MLKFLKKCERNEYQFAAIKFLGRVITTKLKILKHEDQLL